jgi:hypothetical protein
MAILTVTIRGVSRAAEPPPPMTENFERFSSRRRRDPNSSQPPPLPCKYKFSIFQHFAQSALIFSFSHLVSYEPILNYHSLLFLCENFSKLRNFFKRSVKNFSR